ncbi:MAG: hypothetical protein N2109_05810 [Fimbriimonadales bacterium]|nr:hypothetical protein [Fimbriimonadales bacterium]
MALVPLIAALALAAPAETVSLHRVFSKGERSRYEVKAHLVEESRGGGLRTFVPHDTDIVYRFETAVTELKADGIAVLLYRRPTMTITEGETVDSAPKTKVERVDIDATLTVSPINELLNVAENKRPATGRKTLHRRQLGELLDTFVDGLGQMVLFIGSIDSGLDFAPKLPFDDVRPGDTWRRTAGYSPQRLAGQDGKSAVQRLDYTYRYHGVVESNGRKVHRVTAELTVDTDLAEFLHQSIGRKPDQTGLKAIPFKLQSKMEFDLDLGTRRTLRALATSQAQAEVVTTRQAEPVLEQRMRGRTLMRLLPNN